MKRPAAKQAKKAASHHHKHKTQKQAQSGKPVKAAKPVAHKKPVKPAKAAKAVKAVKPAHHKMSRFGRASTVALPETAAVFVDLSTDPAMPPITDQGEGSCIAHASAAMFAWAAAHGHDSGRITSVDVAGIQACLSSGLPVAAGVVVYESFTSDEALRSGVVPMPTRRDRVIDAHYLVVVGIGCGREWIVAGNFPAATPDVRYVKVRNSWGADVYRSGYLLLPVAYLAAHVTELWTVGCIPPQVATWQRDPDGLAS